MRTTEFLTSSLTIKPLPTSNTIFNIQGQQNLQNHRLPTSYLLNHSLTNYESSHNPHPLLESNKNQAVNVHEGNTNGGLQQSNTNIQERANHLMIIKSPIQQLSCEHASVPIMHPLKIEDGSNMVGDLSSDALTHVHGNHLMGVKSSIQQLPYMHMSAPNTSSFEFEHAYDMGGDIMHSSQFPQEHAKHYMTSKSPIQQLSHVHHICVLVK